MKTELPSNFKLLYTREQIEQSNQKLGREISTWAREVWTRSHTDILTIPVLRGGIFFFADLVREIDHSVELTPTYSKVYEEGVNKAMRAEMKTDVDSIPAQGRAVLLVDDICDSGKTLANLTKRLKENGADEVRSAVLVRRIMEQETFKPDWVGMEYKGSEWLVGYGMEDSNRWRNLSSIYIIRQGA